MKIKDIFVEFRNICTLPNYTEFCIPGELLSYFVLRSIVCNMPVAYLIIIVCRYVLKRKYVSLRRPPSLCCIFVETRESGSFEWTREMLVFPYFHCIKFVYCFTLAHSKMNPMLVEMRVEVVWRVYWKCAS